MELLDIKESRSLLTRINLVASECLGHELSYPATSIFENLK